MTTNPLACCICWAGLLGRAIFPPWNEGPNSGSYIYIHIIHICCCSVSKLCLTRCDPMGRDCSTPGSPVLHYLLEFAQIHVRWVDNTIQPSHPLSSPSFAFNLSSIRVFFNEAALRITWPKYWAIYTYYIHIIICIIYLMYFSMLYILYTM